VLQLGHIFFRRRFLRETTTGLDLAAFSLPQPRNPLAHGRRLWAWSQAMRRPAARRRETGAGSRLSEGPVARPEPSTEDTWLIAPTDLSPRSDASWPSLARQSPGSSTGAVSHRQTSLGEMQEAIACPDHCRKRRTNRRIGARQPQRIRAERTRRLIDGPGANAYKPDAGSATGFLTLDQLVVGEDCPSGLAPLDCLNGI
jgi:hypothetical protein